jgi:hypothetical protein
MEPLIKWHKANENKGTGYATSKFAMAIIIFIVSCSFGQAQKQNEKIKQDTIKVEFGNQFLLYWDCVNHKIIKDENYFAILENENNIFSIAHFITNQEIVCDFVCSKDTALKKGDVAFLFLRENKFIEFSCFGIQFDWFNDCKYPAALLDYVENNRTFVFRRVMDCLKYGGGFPRTIPRLIMPEIPSPEISLQIPPENTKKTVRKKSKP